MKNDKNNNKKFENINNKKHILKKLTKQFSIILKYKFKRNDEFFVFKIHILFNFTNNFKNKFNKLLYICQIAYFIIFNLNDIVFILRFVWDSNIKKYD